MDTSDSHSINSRPSPTGDPGKDPRLNSIGDVKTWQRKKARGQLAIQALVANLMETYLGRVVVTREPYAEPPAEATAKLDTDFKYTLTPDQQTAITDVMDDMSRTEPMDRLVGFPERFSPPAAAPVSARQCARGSTARVHALRWHTAWCIFPAAGRERGRDIEQRSPR